MFDTSSVISSLTAAGFDQKQAAAITDAVRKVVATGVAGDIPAELMTEIVESRYAERRKVFYRWLVATMIAAFALVILVIEIQLTSAIARIDLAVARAGNTIDAATENSVAEITIAKNAVPERFGYARRPTAFESADALAPGQRRLVEFQAGRGEHFQIHVPASSTYCIDAISDVGPDAGDPVMYLYRGAQLDEVAYNDDRELDTLDSRICENLAVNEEYYLEVRDLRNLPATLWLSLDIAD